MGELAQIVESFEGKRIVVVGDIILDWYIRGEVERISPEAPVPVVQVKEEFHRPGGAGNVAMNLRSLGADVVLAGHIGDDAHGALLCRGFNARDIDISLARRGGKTTTKMRIMAQGQQICRVDRDYKDFSYVPWADMVATHTAKTGLDAIVVADYSKGVVGATLLLRLRSVFPDVAIVVDPKNKDAGWYKGASFLTPNEREAMIDERKDLYENIMLIEQTTGASGILVTRGEKGMLLYDILGFSDMPTYAKEVYDVTGAGDTVTACFTLAIAAQAIPYQAACLANYAAGIVVGKVGTATVGIEELREALHETT